MQLARDAALFGLEAASHWFGSEPCAATPDRGGRKSRVWSRWWLDRRETLVRKVPSTGGSCARSQTARFPSIVLTLACGEGNVKFDPSIALSLSQNSPSQTHP